MAIRGNALPDGGIFHSDPFAEVAFDPEDLVLPFHTQFSTDGDPREDVGLTDSTWAGAREFVPVFGGLVAAGAGSYSTIFYSIAHPGPIAAEVRDFDTDDVLDTVYILPGSTSSSAASFSLTDDQVAIAIIYAPNQPPYV
jgi:hypothetical protein